MQAEESLSRNFFRQCLEIAEWLSSLHLIAGYAQNAVRTGRPSRSLADSETCSAYKQHSVCTHNMHCIHTKCTTCMTGRQNTRFAQHLDAGMVFLRTLTPQVLSLIPWCHRQWSKLHLLSLGSQLPMKPQWVCMEWRMTDYIQQRVTLSPRTLNTYS